MWNLGPRMRRQIFNHSSFSFFFFIDEFVYTKRPRNSCWLILKVRERYFSTIYMAGLPDVGIRYVPLHMILKVIASIFLSAH